MVGSAKNPLEKSCLRASPKEASQKLNTGHKSLRRKWMKKNPPRNCTFALFVYPAKVLYTLFSALLNYV